MSLNAKAIGHRNLFFEHFHALRRSRYIHATALLQSSGQARLSFKCGIKLNAVFIHGVHIAIRSHLAD